MSLIILILIADAALLHFLYEGTSLFKNQCLKHHHPQTPAPAWSMFRLILFTPNQFNMNAREGHF